MQKPLLNIDKKISWLTENSNVSLFNLEKINVWEKSVKCIFSNLFLCEEKAGYPVRPDMCYPVFSVADICQYAYCLCSLHFYLNASLTTNLNQLSKGLICRYRIQQMSVGTFKARNPGLKNQFRFGLTCPVGSHFLLHLIFGSALLIWRTTTKCVILVYLCFNSPTLSFLLS